MVFASFPLLSWLPAPFSECQSGQTNASHRSNQCRHVSNRPEVKRGLHEKLFSCEQPKVPQNLCLCFCFQSEKADLPAMVFDTDVKHMKEIVAEYHTVIQNLRLIKRPRSGVGLSRKRDGVRQPWDGIRGKHFADLPQDTSQCMN